MVARVEQLWYHSRRRLFELEEVLRAAEMTGSRIEAAPGRGRTLQRLVVQARDYRRKMGCFCFSPGAIRK